jgi:hypothetical protein
MLMVVPDELWVEVAVMVSSVRNKTLGVLAGLVIHESAEGSVGRRDVPVASFENAL